MAASCRPPVLQSTARQLTRRGVLWLGLRCDLDCLFCYDRHVPAGHRTWIPYEQATAALDKFRHFYGNQFVDFMGGEPTGHPRAVDIVRYAAAIGLHPTIITHGLRLARPEIVDAYAEAGLHDVLMSIHGLGQTARQVHGRGTNNFGRQKRALRNLRERGIPIRINCTLIRENMTQLADIAALAGDVGARVVNFITFNPAFEWLTDTAIPFQARHSALAPYLAEAIGHCVGRGIEVNVRYLPLCQLPGLQQHVYTGHQLPFDPHEWDYNSWYDTGHPGQPSEDWYLRASRRQRERHRYVAVPACARCALRDICDGFHEQYAARWGGEEARAQPGPPVSDPRHFIKHQTKIQYEMDDTATPARGRQIQAAPLVPTQFDISAGHRAGLQPGRAQQ